MVNSHSLHETHPALRTGAVGKVSVLPGFSIPFFVDTRSINAGAYQIRSALRSAVAEVQAATSTGRLGYGAAVQQAAKKHRFAITAAYQQLAIITTLPILAALTASILAVKRFDDAFVQVRKNVEATNDQFDELANTIIHMSRRLPQSANKLADIAGVAGRLGIEIAQIPQFVDTVARSSLTIDGSDPLEIAENLARIINAQGLESSDARPLASVVTALESNFAVSGTEIFRVTKAMGGFLNKINFTPDQLMAMGAIAVAGGTEPNTAGTALQKLFTTTQTKLGKAEGGDPKALSEIMDIIQVFRNANANSSLRGLGISSKYQDLDFQSFRTMVYENPAEYFENILLAIEKANASKGEFPILQDIFELGADRRIRTIFNTNLEQIKKAWALARQEMLNPQALDKESEEFIRSISGTWAIAVNNITASLLEFREELTAFSKATALPIKWFGKALGLFFHSINRIPGIVKILGSSLAGIILLLPGLVFVAKQIGAYLHAAAIIAFVDIPAKMYKFASLLNVKSLITLITLPGKILDAMTIGSAKFISKNFISGLNSVMALMKLGRRYRSGEQLNMFDRGIFGSQHSTGIRFGKITNGLENIATSLGNIRKNLSGNMVSKWGNFTKNFKETAMLHQVTMRGRGKPGLFNIRPKMRMSEYSSMMANETARRSVQSIQEAQRIQTDIRQQFALNSIHGRMGSRRLSGAQRMMLRTQSQYLMHGGDPRIKESITNAAIQQSRFMRAQRGSSQFRRSTKGMKPGMMRNMRTNIELTSQAMSRFADSVRMNVSAAFTSAGLAVQRFVGSTVSLKPKLDSFIRNIRIQFQLFMTYMRTTISGFIPTFSLLMTNISTKITEVFATFKLRANLITADIKQYFQDAWNSIKEHMQTVMTKMRTVFSTAMTRIKNVASTAFIYIRYAMSGTFARFRDVLTAFRTGTWLPFMKGMATSVYTFTKKMIISMAASIRSVKGLKAAFIGVKTAITSIKLAAILPAILAGVVAITGSMGAWILGILAVASGALLLVKNWEVVEHTMKIVFSAIKIGVFEVIKYLLNLITPWTNLINVIPGVDLDWTGRIKDQLNEAYTELGKLNNVPPEDEPPPWTWNFWEVIEEGMGKLTGIEGWEFGVEGKEFGKRAGNILSKLLLGAELGDLKDFIWGPGLSFKPHEEKDGQTKYDEDGNIVPADTSIDDLAKPLLVDFDEAFNRNADLYAGGDTITINVNIAGTTLDADTLTDALKEGYIRGKEEITGSDPRYGRP